MRWILLAGFAVAAISGVFYEPARAQTATLPISPDKSIPPDIVYPDAVTCDVTSPTEITYRMIFYKSQTISFGTEVNNEAEYGTPFDAQPGKSDTPFGYTWRLQLGKPGNITVFTLPPGWHTGNCTVGKTIANLIANKQALRIFTPQ